MPRPETEPEKGKEPAMSYFALPLCEVSGAAGEIDPVLGSAIVLAVFAVIAVIFGWMLTIMRKNRKSDRGRKR